MITATTQRARTARLSVWAVCVVTISGCASHTPHTETSPARASAPILVAVAPAMNFSGSKEFDPLRVADLMASELTLFEHVNVIEVNRVLAVLARRQAGPISSPDDAVEIARMLGADAILVFAITEYDPNDPPVVGIAAQLYGTEPDVRLAGWSPVAASRRATPDAGAAESVETRPRAESQRVFIAADRSVAKDVLRFADERDVGRNPFGARLYTVSQEHFLRYCCNAAARELLGRQRPVGQTTPGPRTEPTE
jgi:hypothetical protein